MPRVVKQGWLDCVVDLTWEQLQSTLYTWPHSSSPSSTSMCCANVPRTGPGLFLNTLCGQSLARDRIPHRNGSLAYWPRRIFFTSSQEKQYGWLTRLRLDLRLEQCREMYSQCVLVLTRAYFVILTWGNEWIFNSRHWLFCCCCCLY